MAISVRAAMPNFHKLMDENQTTPATFYAWKIPFVTEINRCVSFLSSSSSSSSSSSFWNDAGANVATLPICSNFK